MGVVIEVKFADKPLREIVLPGSSLAYGRCDAVNQLARSLFAM